MKEQYYKIVGHEVRDRVEGVEGYASDSEAVPIYELVDIGWRYCKDELPESEDTYVVMLRRNKMFSITTAFFLLTGEWTSMGDYVTEHVVQWCKLPKPLRQLTAEEEETERIAAESFDKHYGKATNMLLNLTDRQLRLYVLELNKKIERLESGKSNIQ